MFQTGSRVLSNCIGSNNSYCVIPYLITFFHYCSFISSWISKEALERCKECIELIANKLQLVGFSRIDASANVDSGEVCWFHSATGQAFPFALCYITNTGKILAWIIELLGLHVHFQKKFCLPIINNATPDSFLFTTELFNYSINFHLLQVLIIEVIQYSAWNDTFHCSKSSGKSLSL